MTQTSHSVPVISHCRNNLPKQAYTTDAQNFPPLRISKTLKPHRSTRPTRIKPVRSYSFPDTQEDQRSVGNVRCSILSHARTSVLTWATLPNPIADPAIHRADRRGTQTEGDSHYAAACRAQESVEATREVLEELKVQSQAQHARVQHFLVLHTITTKKSKHSLDLPALLPR